ncbi:hypothetical protein K7X08_002040 [Anisodus acutangulus]|uniref:CSC1-like protein RXW8 n=1 Tax=Anisodus acutangulus TaxID=402998 RepID=A0A9Q1LRZ2_9SOLA|nr:hypothetical protein K7X08_002040 [Anisodus acutangulus]
MKLAALLTSAGINTAVCVVLFSLYSILRKQPSFVNVYFGAKIAQVRARQQDAFGFDRFVPSPSWILKAWEISDEEICATGGLDAMVFVRMIVFSFRIFSIAAIVCNFLVLPLNYFGKEMQRHQIPAETLEVFTIVNVEEGSRWLWAHCIALYLISCLCMLCLFYCHKRSSLAFRSTRLANFTSSVSNPSYFTVLVRAIPWSREESYSGTVTRFFTNFYASSFLSHQIVYRSGSVKKLVTDAGKMCKMLKLTPRELHIGSNSMRCGLCGTTALFSMLPMDAEGDKGRNDFGGSDLRKKLFENRYTALVASQGLQSRNPMSWVTNLSPEPADMYWSNICVPYRLLWIRKIAILVASMALVAFFVVPVSLTQGLVHLDKLQKTFPFLKGVLKRKAMSQLATGYLPSAVLIIFMYMVPPKCCYFLPWKALSLVVAGRGVQA